MRFALLITVLLACSTNGKREDNAPMSPPNQPSDSPYVGPKVHVSTAGGEVTVKVEVVATNEKIRKGLMYRKHLPTDAGMLFLMGQERDHEFWMRNTLIPLDMLFIDKDMTVVGIVENAEPLTETLRSVGKISSYVLEVNAGWSKEHHVSAGAKVRFENVGT